MSESMSLSRVGLPKGHGLLTLAYHHGTKTLIAHTRHSARRWPYQRLWLRRFEERRYKLAHAFPTRTSIDSFSFSLSCPFLYFTTQTLQMLRIQNPPNVLIGRKVVAMPGVGLSHGWDALYQLNLLNSRCKLLAQRGGLMVPKGYNDAWLVTLLSTQYNGRKLFVRAALQRSFYKAKAPILADVDYYVAELHLANMKLVPIARLDATFA